MMHKIYSCNPISILILNFQMRKRKQTHEVNFESHSWSTVEPKGSKCLRSDLVGSQKLFSQHVLPFYTDYIRIYIEDAPENSVKMDQIVDISG